LENGEKVPFVCRQKTDTENLESIGIKIPNYMTRQLLEKRYIFSFMMTSLKAYMKILFFLAKITAI
jgi:hypothetical protein